MQLNLIYIFEIKLFEQNDNLLDNFSKVNTTNDMKGVVILLKENVKYFNSVDASSLIKHIESGKYRKM